MFFNILDNLCVDGAAYTQLTQYSLKKKYKPISYLIYRKS